MELLKASKKQNNIKSGALAAKRLRKRNEAMARQAASDKLTLDQKLAKATPGSREHTRLLNRVNTKNTG